MQDPVPVVTPAAINAVELPEWLSVETSIAPVATIPANQKITLRELEQTTYGNLFEHALVEIEQGQPLSAIIEKDNRDINYGAFMRWIHKDPIRRARYYESQEIGAEFVAGDMLKIADAENSLEDVQRSTLRINTRKYLLGVWNRRRFGEIKQLEHTGAISITQALVDARARIFDGQAEVIDDAETDI